MSGGVPLPVQGLSMHRSVSANQVQMTSIPEVQQTRKQRLRFAEGQIDLLNRRASQHGQQMTDTIAKIEQLDNLIKELTITIQNADDDIGRLRHRVNELEQDKATREADKAAKAAETAKKARRCCFSISKS